MKEDIVTDELLVGYALGRLSDEEQERVEKRMFKDRQVFERLQVVEDELIDAYASGRLTEGDRGRFEKYFLQSHEDRERVEFARELAAVVSGESQSLRTKESPARRRHWFEFTRIKNLWVLVPVAAALLITIGALWLVFQTIRLNDRFQQIQVERDAREKREQDLERQLSEERERSQQLAEELERERIRSASKDQADSTAGTSARSLVSFILMPGAVRDRGSAARLVIPTDARQVRLQARFRTGDYRSYQAELQTVEGRQLWQRAGLRAQKHGDERAVSLEVPAAIFRQDDYVLILSGVNAAGEKESVGEYYFRVVRP